MNHLAAAILITWQRNGAYGVRLVDDLAAAQSIAQPIRGRVMNHPAWILSHLNLYASIAIAMCRAERFDDPAKHRYGQKSEPLADPGAYETPSEMLHTWWRLHDEGTTALRAVTDAVTSAPTPLDRWRALHPTVGDMLVTLMVKHESAHLGQLSAWRRAMGLPRVAM